MKYKKKRAKKYMKRENKRPKQDNKKKAREI